MINNERIEQLAEQADWWKPRGLPSNWDDGDYVVSPKEMKKFAELIVKECASVAETRLVDLEGHSFEIEETLLKHFGVKND